MRLLLCIDDTDNLDSIGTGQLLEEMCQAMEEIGLATGGFVTRHQLFLHEDIEYTSHNSSMCCEVRTDHFEKTVAYAQQYLQDHAAEGSDPGLCVLNMQGLKWEKERRPEVLELLTPLMNFGKKAQEEVLTKEEAYQLAKSYGDRLVLSEHGGTGDGIIGALAGVGLRLTGQDGRIKGKILPENGSECLTAAEFALKYKMKQMIDEEGNPIPSDTMLTFTKACKAIMKDGKVTMIVRKTEEGGYEPLPHHKRH